MTSGEEERRSQHYDPIGSTFLLVGFLSSVFLVILVLGFYSLILQPKFNEYLLAKAKGHPDMTSPRLNFFPIPYNYFTHAASQFTVSSLESCLGLSPFSLS